MAQPSLSHIRRHDGTTERDLRDRDCEVVSRLSALGGPDGTIDRLLIDRLLRCQKAYQLSDLLHDNRYY